LNKSRISEIVVQSPQCFLCKHLNHETLRCPAFGEKQIPEDIQYNLRDHHYPFPGDRNVRFEKRATVLSMSDSLFTPQRGR